MAINRCNIKEQLSDTWKIIFYLALILITAIIGYFMGSSGAVRGMVIGVIVGVVFHWRTTAKASLRIRNTLVPYAKTWTEGKGYILREKDSEFVPNTHRLLRFDSQNIRFLWIDESSTAMFGPYYMLKIFAKSS